MPKRAERDFAVRVVEQAIGEHIDGTPLEQPKPKSRRAAGGKVGGAARAKVLSPTRKREIAVRAAETRWSKSLPQKSAKVAEEQLIEHSNRPR
jgi:hypothetical protein